MPEKLGQEPAFPCEVVSDEHGTRPVQTGSNSYMDFGMSKRLYIATKAMQSVISANMISDFENENTCNWIAEISFKMADALLKQENQ